MVLLVRAHPRLSLVVIICACGAAWAAFSFLLPTDTRKIKDTIAALVDGLIEGDTQKVLEQVSPYFAEQGLDRARLGRTLQVALQKRPVTRAVFVVREIEIQSIMAQARIQVLSTHKSARRSGRARSEWIVELERMDGRWLVRGAEPLEVNNLRVGGLRAVIAMAR